MNKGVVLSFAIASIVVAVLLSVGAARETTGQPWRPPPPTATARIVEVTRLEFVVITATPEPTPYTEATYRRAQEAGIVPTARPTATPDRGTGISTDRGSPSWTWPSIGGS